MGKKRKSQANTEVDGIVQNKIKAKKVKHIEIKNTEIDKNPNTIINTVRPVNKVDNKSDSSKPKKIIFIDDQPQEVPVIQDVKKEEPLKVGTEPNINILREEDIRDEDIDKFCDELDEEDNKQYENWVELIEANLRSNKKKPK